MMRARSKATASTRMARKRWRVASQAEIERQKRTNRSSLRHRESFGAHRRHLTALLLPEGTDPGLSLCVLGAGNCQDLDLERLAAQYAAIHLVDLDAQALIAARDRQPPDVRARIVCEPAVDLSGMLEVIDRWAEMQVDPSELLAHPGHTARRLAARLGRFDVVLSACMLSQMHLSLLNILTDRHPLHAALSYTLTLTHLRCLELFRQPAGRALLATDAARLDQLDLQPYSELEPAPLLGALLARHQVFDAVDPRLLDAMVRDDPELSERASLSEPLDVWVWTNGPEQRLLVYALELASQAGAR